MGRTMMVLIMESCILKVVVVNVYGVFRTLE